MYKKFLAALAILGLLTALLAVLPIHGEERIYDDVLRLHVLANSDSDFDQALKLSVRDAILEVTRPLLSDVHSREQAKEALLASLSDIRSAAEQTIATAGFSYPVSLELGIEKYPTRQYDELCFPSGEYLSLRVKIGKAEGENWWCVLFPPLCLGAASGGGYVDVGLGGEEYNIITENENPKYKIRFKLLEAVQEMVH